MRWTLRLRADGGEDTLEADAIVSGVGQLNRPHIPELPGADTFAGPAFHSARWDHDVDLAGKRVVVIGTGASAAQFVPGDRRAGRPPHDPPAHAGLVPPHPRLPRRRRARGGVAAAERARLHELAPLLELLAERRGPDDRGPGRPGVGQRRRQREPGQRADPAALRPAPAGGAGRAPRPAALGHARLPAVLEAVHPRRRRLGAHASCATTSTSSPSPIAEITPDGRAHRGRHAARGRRPHLRHRVHGVRLPHADAHRRARRRRAARQVEGRRPRLPRRHAARATRTCSCSTDRTPTSS